MSSKTGQIDLKVVLLGRYYCGKTSVVERFVNGIFNERYQNTIGAAFSARTIRVKNEDVTVAVWDTVGDEKYESISRLYYRGAKAAIVCYDLTDTKSWERALFWVDEVLKNEEKCKLYLCGTKLDLLEGTDRAVDFRDVSKYAKSVGAKEFETSSRTGENIYQLFESIAEDYLGFKMTLDSDDIGAKAKNTIRLGDQKLNVFQKLQRSCCSP